jgi:hypothetical protein
MLIKRLFVQKPIADVCKSRNKYSKIEFQLQLSLSLVVADFNHRTSVRKEPNPNVALIGFQ